MRKKTQLYIYLNFPADSHTTLVWYPFQMFWLIVFMRIRLFSKIVTDAYKLAPRPEHFQANK